MKSAIVEKCKLCHSDLKYMFEANNCKIAGCPQCGFVQMLDEDKTSKYEYDKGYFINSKYKDASALEKEHARRKSLVKKYLVQGGGYWTTDVPRESLLGMWRIFMRWKGVTFQKMR